MTKKICFLLFVLLSMQGYAQTGIGTSTPHASAKLDVSATNKGFLPPRVTLTAATDAVTIPSPAEGLLVYNLGSVGLQAGYYYWNGANWATIATGTTAGNAVIASDLVKLYGEAWSSATGKIGNTNGYSFTVPISGRYAFDFSSTTYGSTSFTINFYVRQGTTNLASDGQVSTNNGVRVEYNGKFEVNLQAGTTYNVYVTSTNINRGSEDYDRVYYKMVAGNLPVNQHMAERNIQLNNNYLSNDGGNEGIRVDNSGNVGIGTSSPTEKLEVSGNVKATNFIGNGSQITGVPTNITYGEIDVPQALAVATGFVDLVNIPLPNAGTFKITYVVRASITTNGTLAVLALRNGSNTQVSGTEAMAVYNLSNVQVTCSRVCVVTTTAAETYKLSVWTQANAGNFNAINDGNGRSKVLWEKIQ